MISTVFTAVETVRSPWSPLVVHFQKTMLHLLVKNFAPWSTYLPHYQNIFSLKWVLSNLSLHEHFEILPPIKAILSLLQALMLMWFLSPSEKAQQKYWTSHDPAWLAHPHWAPLSLHPQAQGNILDIATYHPRLIPSVSIMKTDLHY